jgi:hypothetical protein
VYKQTLTHHIIVETFIVEDPNDTPSNSETVKNVEADSDLDHEMVDLSEEPSRFSEAVALEISAELI